MYIRDREVEECAVCGREFDKLRMTEIFTGRVRYICLECSRKGDGQVNARQTEWRNTYRGKTVIEHCEKNK